MSVFNIFANTLLKRTRVADSLSAACLTLIIVSAATLRRDGVQDRSVGTHTLEEQVTRLVTDGSDDSVRRLEAMFKSGDRDALDAAARGLVRIAEKRMIARQLDAAYGLAINIWLSSSPHDARQDAWKVIFLAEQAPRMLAEGHTVVVEAPGGRDHKRFARWLTEQYLDTFAWVIDLDITYRPTVIEADRASETARITFVLDDAAREAELLQRLARPGQTYRADEWSVVQLQRLSIAANAIGRDDRTN